MIFAFSAQCTASPKAQYTWSQLRDGLQYATYSFAIAENDRTRIHAFRIDPARYRLSVATAKDEKGGTTASKMANEAGALIAINGGFFTPEHTSIGLIIKDGKRLNPLHRTSWWSIFYIKGDKAAIATPSSFRPSSAISTALQVGPRLTINGATPKLKEGVSARSAVGIDRQGKVVILITSGHGISMKELAKRMGGTVFQGGMGCPNSMALDGGSSSQIYAKIGDFKLDIAGLARVTNGLVVLPKKRNSKS